MSDIGTPPDFLKDEWLKFNSNFNDEKILLNGKPDADDLLGISAVFGHKAGFAVKEKRYDLAWWLYNQVKLIELKHAQKFNFDARQIIRTDSCISRPMANLLRLEGKHRDALVHFIYCVVGDTREPSKSDLKKIKAYFNRAKFENISHQDLLDQISFFRGNPDFTEIRDEVNEWF